MTTVSENKRIAFVRLGMMGYPMAGRLARCRLSAGGLRHQLRNDKSIRPGVHLPCLLLRCSMRPELRRSSSPCCPRLGSGLFIRCLATIAGRHHVGPETWRHDFIDISSSDPLRSREFAGFSQNTRSPWLMLLFQEASSERDGDTRHHVWRFERIIRAL